MAKTRLGLSLKGFEEMLGRIEAAGGDVDKAARACMEKSINVLESNLIAEAQASGAGTSTVAHTVSSEGNRITAETGWKLGEYNSSNPSEGYEALFTEFGTGKYSTRGKGKDRHTRAGANRGSTAPRPFISAARKKSAKPIRAIQQETLQNIVKELRGE